MNKTAVGDNGHIFKPTSTQIQEFMKTTR